MKKPPKRTLRLDLRTIREELGLSQSELADLLAVSLRNIQSCEQEWRAPSPSLERSLILLLMAHRNGASMGKNACWKQADCPAGMRSGCISFRSRQGHLCWLMTGTLCKGFRLRGWYDKMKMCMECDYFRLLLKGDLPVLPER